MTLEEIKTWVDNKLSAFKLRMRIGSNAEDKNLRQMLTSSATTLIRLTGARDLDDPTLVSLIFDRARYEYNDALDEFVGNYHEEINMLYVQYGLEGDADDNKPETGQE
ncbi:hypothetical protein [Pseudolactococcus reticulitermitis]|uniref:Phage gp6-like head-tail connector protein n=1 Tax=Pseudolactococcus reticulitermitis TaxID=2025039 RepID=A0A224X788_9LACT|nr:hypothetical protein [Lactococcus reticulitermitis]GAX47310.1 hypothetical protein RsY01_909 [Lactococcus reticulitermitis]